MKLHLPVKLRASLIAAVIAVSASVYNAGAESYVAPSDAFGWTTNDMSLTERYLATSGNTYTAVSTQYYVFKVYPDSAKRVGYVTLADGSIQELSYDMGYYYTNVDGARVDVETPNGYYVLGTASGATDESYIPVTVTGDGTVDSPIVVTPATTGDAATLKNDTAQITIHANGTDADGRLVSVMDGNTTFTTNGELRVENSVKSKANYAGNVNIDTNKIVVTPDAQNQGSIVVLEDVSITDYDDNGDTTPIATEIGQHSKLVIVDGDMEAVSVEAKRWMNLEGVSSTEGLEYRQNSVNLGAVSGTGSLTIVGSKDEEGNGNLTAAIASITGAGADVNHRFGEVNVANADVAVTGDISNATTVSLSNSDATVGGHVTTKGLNVDSEAGLEAVGTISNVEGQGSGHVDISGSVTSTTGSIRLANGKADAGLGIKEGAELSAGQDIWLSNVDAVNPGAITAGGNLTLTNNSTLQDAGTKEVTEGDTTVTVPVVQVGGDLVVEGGSSVSDSSLEVDGSVKVDGEGSTLDNVTIEGGEGIEVTNGGSVVGSDIVNATADIKITGDSTLSAKDGKGFVLTTQGTFEEVDDDTYNGGSIIVDGATLKNGIIKSGVTATRGEDGTYSFVDVPTTETAATDNGVAIGDVKLPYGEINIKNSTLENMTVTTAAGDIQLQGEVKRVDKKLDPAPGLEADNKSNGMWGFLTSLQALGGDAAISELNPIYAPVLESIAVMERPGGNTQTAGNIRLQIKDGETVVGTSKAIELGVSGGYKTFIFPENEGDPPVRLDPTKTYKFVFVGESGAEVSVGLSLTSANLTAPTLNNEGVANAEHSALVYANVGVAESFTNTIKGAVISTGNGKLAVDRTYLTRAEDGTRNSITATQAGSTLTNSYVEGTDITVNDAAGTATAPAESLTVRNSILRGDVKLAAGGMIYVSDATVVALDGDAVNTTDDAVEKNASIAAAVLYLDALKDNTASIKNGTLGMTGSTILKDTNTLALENVSGTLGNLMDVVESTSTAFGAATVSIKGGSSLTAAAIGTDWKDGEGHWSPEAGDATAQNSYFGNLNIEGNSKLTATGTVMIQNYRENVNMEHPDHPGKFGGADTDGAEGGSKVTFGADAHLTNALLIGVGHEPTDKFGKISKNNEEEAYGVTSTTINGNAHIGNLRLDKEAVLNLVNTGEGEVTSSIANIKPGYDDEWYIGEDKGAAHGTINVVKGTLKTPDLYKEDDYHKTYLSLGLNGGTVVLEAVEAANGATVASEAAANAHVYVREITNAAIAGSEANVGQSTIKATVNRVISDYSITEGKPTTEHVNNYYYAVTSSAGYTVPAGQIVSEVNEDGTLTAKVEGDVLPEGTVIVKTGAAETATTVDGEVVTIGVNTTAATLTPYEQGCLSRITEPVLDENGDYVYTIAGEVVDGMLVKQYVVETEDTVQYQKGWSENLGETKSMTDGIASLTVAQDFDADNTVIKAYELGATDAQDKVTRVPGTGFINIKGDLTGAHNTLTADKNIELGGIVADTAEVSLETTSVTTRLDNTVTSEKGNVTIHETAGTSIASSGNTVKATEGTVTVEGSIKGTNNTINGATAAVVTGGLQKDTVTVYNGLTQQEVTVEATADHNTVTSAGTVVIGSPLTMETVDTIAIDGDSNAITSTKEGDVYVWGAIKGENNEVSATLGNAAVMGNIIGGAEEGTGNTVKSEGGIATINGIVGNWNTVEAKLVEGDERTGKVNVLGTVQGDHNRILAENTATVNQVVGNSNTVSAANDVTVTGTVTGEDNLITSTKGNVSINGSIVGQDGDLGSNSVVAYKKVSIGTLAGEQSDIASYGVMSTDDEAIRIDTFAAQGTNLHIFTTSEEAGDVTCGNGSISIGTMSAAKQWDAEGNLVPVAEIDKQLMNTIVSNNSFVKINRMDGSNAYTTVTAAKDVIIGTGDAAVNDTASNMTIDAAGLQVTNGSLTLADSKVNVDSITGTSLTLTTTGEDHFTSTADSVALDSLTLANNAVLNVDGDVVVNNLTLDGTDGQTTGLLATDITVKQKATVMNGAVLNSAVLAVPELEIINGTLGNIGLVSKLQGLTATGATVIVNSGLDGLTRDIIAQAVYVDANNKAIVDPVTHAPILTGDDIAGATLQKAQIAAASLATTADILADRSDITSLSTIAGNDITAQNGGNITAGGDITATGAVTAGLATEEDVSDRSTITTTGVLRGASLAVDHSDVTAKSISLTDNGALEAHRNASITGKVTGAGNVTVDGGSTVAGNVGMSGALTVGKAADTERSSITGNVTGATGATLNHADIGALTMTDAAAVEADVTANDSTIGGKITNANDVTLDGTNVAGSVTMDGALGMTGSSAGDVTGATSADLQDATIGALTLAENAADREDEDGNAVASVIAEGSIIGGDIANAVSVALAGGSTVKGNVGMSGALTVGKAGDTERSSITGNVTGATGATLNHADITGNLAMTDAAAVEADVEATDSSIGGNITNANDVALTGTNVAGSVAMDGALEMTGGSAASVTGATGATLSEGATIEGALTMTDAAAVEADVEATGSSIGSIANANDVTLTGTDVAGSVAMDGALEMTGGSAASVTGATGATLSEGASITGDLAMTDAAAVEADVEATGSSIGGNITNANDVALTGGSTVGGSVTMDGALTVGNEADTDRSSVTGSVTGATGATLNHADIGALTMTAAAEADVTATDSTIASIANANDVTLDGTNVAGSVAMDGALDLSDSRLEQGVTGTVGNVGISEGSYVGSGITSNGSSITVEGASEVAGAITASGENAVVTVDGKSSTGAITASGSNATVTVTDSTTGNINAATATLNDGSTVGNVTANSLTTNGVVNSGAVTVGTAQAKGSLTVNMGSLNAGDNAVIVHGTTTLRDGEVNAGSFTTEGLRHIGADVELDSLASDGTVSLVGGSLTVHGNVDIDAVAGNPANPGNLEINGATMVVDNNGSISVEGTTQLENASSLTGITLNTHGLTVEGGSRVTMSGTAASGNIALNNGALTVDNSTVEGNITGAQGATVRDGSVIGSITMTGGDLTVTSADADDVADVDNVTGAVNATLTNAEAGSIGMSGNLVANNARIGAIANSIRSAQVTNRSHIGSDLTASGNITVSDSTVTGSVTGAAVTVTDSAITAKPVATLNAETSTSGNVVGSESVSVTGGSVEGMVVGGSVANGVPTASAQATVTDATVGKGVYGTTVRVEDSIVQNGGVHGTATTVTGDSEITGNVVGSTSATVTGDAIDGAVVKGMVVGGTVADNGTVNRTGTATVTDATVTNGVYGTTVQVEDSTVQNGGVHGTATTVTDSTITGDVEGTTSASVTGGSVAGNVTGGTVGTTGAAITGNVVGSTSATVTGGSVDGKVVGGTVANGVVTATQAATVTNATVGDGVHGTTVKVTASTVTGGVHGTATTVGGNSTITGDVEGSTSATVTGGSVTGNVTGGTVSTTGTAITGNVVGSASATVTGGTVGGMVVGGSVANGVVTATQAATVEGTIVANGVHGTTVRVTDATVQDGGVHGTATTVGNSTITGDVEGTTSASLTGSSVTGNVTGGTVEATGTAITGNVSGTDVTLTTTDTATSVGGNVTASSSLTTNGNVTVGALNEQGERVGTVTVGTAQAKGSLKVNNGALTAGAVTVHGMTTLNNGTVDAGAFTTEGLTTTNTGGTINGALDAGTGAIELSNGEPLVVEGNVTGGSLALVDQTLDASGYKVETQKQASLADGSQLIADNLIVNAGGQTDANTPGLSVDASTVDVKQTITMNNTKLEVSGGGSVEANTITGANGVTLTSGIVTGNLANVQGDISLTQDPDLDQRSVLNGNIGSATDATKAHNVTVADSTVNGDIYMNGALDVDNSAVGDVTGATGATLADAETGDLAMAPKAEGASSFTADVTADASTIGGNITNANDVTLTGGSTVDGSVTMDGTLTMADAYVGDVSGAKATDISGTAIAGSLGTGDLDVREGGSLTSIGDISANGEIALAGDIASNTGDISLNGKADKEGNKSSINADVTAAAELTLDGEFDAKNAALVGNTVNVQGILNAGEGVTIDGELVGDGTVNIKTGKDTFVLDGKNNAFTGNLNVSGKSTLEAADGANLGKLTVTEGSTFEIAGEGIGTAKAASLTMAAGTAMMSDVNLANGNVDTLDLGGGTANLNGATVVLRTGGFANEAVVADQSRLSIVKAGSVASSVNGEVLHTLDTLNVHTENTGKSIDLVFSKNYKGVTGKTFNQNQAAAGLASLEAAHATGELANVLDALHHTRSEADARAALDSLGGSGLAGIQKVMADDTKEHLQTLRSTLKSAAAGLQYRYNEYGQLEPGKESNALAGSVTGGHTEVSGNGNSGEYQRDSIGFMLAYAHALPNKDWKFGADLAYSYADATCDSTTITSDVVYFDLALMHDRGRFHQMGTLGFAMFSFDTEREARVNAAGRSYAGKADGSTNALEFNLSYEMNYDLVVRDQHKLSSVVLAEASFAQFDSMTESGMGNAGLNSEWDDTANLTFGLGGRYTYTFGEERNPGYFMAEALFVAETGDTMPKVSNSFIGGGAAFDQEGPDAGDCGLRLNAGVLVPLGDQWGVFGNVTSEFRENQTGVGGSVGVKCSF